jgi:hypothetical protein
VRLAKRVIEPDLVIRLDESNPERRRNEALHLSISLLEDVFTVDDLGDVLGDGGVGSYRTRRCQNEKRGGKRRRKRTDAVLVHQADEVCFGQEVGLCCCSLSKLEFIGHEAFADFEVGEVVSVPLVVDVDVEVVALADDETCERTLELAGKEETGKAGKKRTTRRKLLPSDLDLDSRRHPSSVLRAATEEAADDEVVNGFLFASEVVDMRCWVNRRMGFVVLPPVARPFEAAVVEKAARDGEYVWEGRRTRRLTWSRMFPSCCRRDASRSSRES